MTNNKGDQPDLLESTDVAKLQTEILRLRKVVASLSSRVEKSLESNTSAFTIFERNIVLNDLVRSRTVDLEKLTESLTDERSKLSSIVSAVPGLILAFHRDGTILERLAGSGQTLSVFLLCQNFSDLPQSFHEMFEVKRIQIENGIPQFVRFCVDDRWYSASCSRTSSHGMVVHFTDITEQAMNEEIILEQRAKITDAAKFSSLGVMAGGVAHEINNPLAIISGKAQGIIRKLGQDDVKLGRVSHDLKMIVKTVDRIARIVRGLRAVSRSGHGDPFESAELAEVVEDSVSLCRERFNASGINFSVIDIPQIHVRCRPTQIAQVLINLLNNAFDAVESQSMVSDAPKWIELRFVVQQSHVEIKVMDSGDGVPTELLDRIMTPFFTTKEVGKGTGLGLSISNSIARDHGGTLEYDTASENTCFKLSLPIAN